MAAAKRLAAGDAAPVLPMHALIAAKAVPAAATRWKARRHRVDPRGLSAAARALPAFAVPVAKTLFVARRLRPAEEAVDAVKRLPFLGRRAQKAAVVAAVLGLFRLPDPP